MKPATKPGNAPKRTAPQKKKSGGGTLVGIFVGLVVGLAIAFGVVWYLNKSPLPFQHKEAAPRAADKPAAANGAPGTPGAAAPAAPAPLPGKPGDKPTDRSADKQRFEFYGILEGKQQATPGKPGVTGAPVAVSPAPTPAAPAAAAADAAKPGETFYLQAGAFQKAADADNLKAKLALSGLEASVQEVSIPDKGTMHRVRVGPYKSPDEMNRARTQLSQAGVQATVIKQKD